MGIPQEEKKAMNLYLPKRTAINTKAEPLELSN